jgi:hypothetical protein
VVVGPLRLARLTTSGRHAHLVEAQSVKFDTFASVIYWHVPTRISFLEPTIFLKNLPLRKKKWQIQLACLALSSGTRSTNAPMGRVATQHA